jgi:LmbE family N-acetylglucosaminyl deacetylase
MLIVAHPDDEAIGAGMLLQRIQDPLVVFCTDGGPKDEFFWKAHGSRQEYVRVRHEEARNAAEIAGVKKVAFLDFPDQELFLHLRDALTELEKLASRHNVQAVLTHAYEGGHPDHDSCAFLGYLLGRNLELPVWEMPLYHRTKAGGQAQTFVERNGRSVRVRVKASELETKRRMVDAHKSQNLALSPFDLAVERFRPQAVYDYRRPPKAEVINYEAWQWRMEAVEVAAAFSALLSEVDPPARVSGPDTSL